MEKNQNLNLNKTQNSDLKEIIEINLSLNQRDESLTQEHQDVEFQNIKEDSIDICKMCMNENCKSVNKSLCLNCISRVKNYRISNLFFIGGGIVGFSVSSAALSVNAISGVSIGLCLAIFLQNFYTLFLLFRIK
jgi:hypothetical protein